jgi:hypothetical protein
MTMNMMGLLQLSGPDKVTIGLLSLDDPQRGLMLLLNDTQHFSNNVKGELGRIPLDWAQAGPLTSAHLPHCP